MRKFFTMSFDDGTTQDIRFVKLINKYNLKCTFNINSGKLGQKNKLTQDGITFDHSEIEANMVKDLYKGHEVAAHTVSHPYLPHLSKGKIIEEVLEDCKALESICNYPIKGMAYPGGGVNFNDFVSHTIAENTPIKYARTTLSHHTFEFPKNFMQWHPTCHQNDEELFDLADKFINAKADGDLLFFLWGHSFEFDKYNNWDTFELFCKKISNLNDVSYVTNYEFLCHTIN